MFVHATFTGKPIGIKRPFNTLRTKAAAIRLKDGETPPQQVPVPVQPKEPQNDDTGEWVFPYWT